MLFDYITRKLRFLSRTQKTHRPKKSDEQNMADSWSMPPFGTDLEVNLSSLRDMFGDSNDLKLRRFKFGPNGDISGALLFIDGLVSSDFIAEAIVRPAVTWGARKNLPRKGRELIEAFEQEVLFAGEIEPADSLTDLARGCLSGNAIVILDGCDTGLIVSAKGWDKRSVSEPQSETVVRGPREGFTENMRTNTALIRRKIRHERLRVDHTTIGRKTRTDICIMYLDGVANPKVVDTVKYRLAAIDVDSILESGYIEQYIEDAPFSPFATVGFSEKPDVIAARILEGRTAIVVDGTPFVLTVPMQFIESFQTSEDYYTRPLYASVTRMLRFAAYLIAVFAPAVYIALAAFHQEMIPTTLLFTIANAREGTPFPVLVEMAIMIFAFEILREAGIRLPRPVGQAISIVGALIMGDAAVSAGLVGAPVVITVAIAAVSTFLVPSQSDSASVLRVGMMLLAATVGWYGISMGFLALLFHLSSLKSFGVPYFEGLAWTHDLQDTLVRMPLWAMIKRPRRIAVGDTTRRRFFVPPLRPLEKSGNSSEDVETPKGKQQ